MLPKLTPDYLVHVARDLRIFSAFYEYSTTACPLPRYPDGGKDHDIRVIGYSRRTKVSHERISVHNLAVNDVQRRMLPVLMTVPDSLSFGATPLRPLASLESTTLGLRFPLPVTITLSNTSTSPKG